MTESGSVDTAPLQTATAEATTRPAAAQVLRGGEIIELSLKPSHWYILITSGRTLGVMVVLACVLPLLVGGLWTWYGQLALQGVLAVALGRIAIGMLQWASRLYVLTNRRVLVFKGIVTVTISECPLERIGSLELESRWYHRVLRLGTLLAVPGTGQKHDTVAWEHIKRPQETRERLLRAIRQAGPPGE